MVDVHGVHSDPKSRVCGVPQSSILGPLLFLIFYVKDVEKAVSCKLLLYADDSALLISGSSVDVIEGQLSSGLERINEWLVSNKLSLHLGKADSIIFGSKRNLAKRSHLNISCGDKSISAKGSVTYLGIKLDQTLSNETMGRRVMQNQNQG